MKIEIKNRFNDKIILCGEYESIKECLERNNGADLREADLNGANLSGASLYEAKNIQLPIINLTGSRHHFFYLNGEIQIGCEKHTVAHWIENYKTIGEANEYTEDQIKEYFGYINMVNNLIEAGKV